MIREPFLCSYDLFGADEQRLFVIACDFRVVEPNGLQILCHGEAVKVIESLKFCF